MSQTINFWCEIPTIWKLQKIFSSQHWIKIISVMKAQTSINGIMSFLPKPAPHCKRSGCRATIDTRQNVLLNWGTWSMHSQMMALDLVQWSRAVQRISFLWVRGKISYQEQSTDFYFMWILFFSPFQSYGFWKIWTKWKVSMCKRRVEMCAFWVRMDTTSMSLQIRKPCQWNIYSHRKNTQKRWMME